MSLARLAGSQSAWIGKQVTTSGRIEEQRDLDGGHYYALADPARNLVILVPAARARRYPPADSSAGG